jgi:hypothetical protein
MIFEPKFPRALSELRAFGKALTMPQPPLETALYIAAMSAVLVFLFSVC